MRREDFIETEIVQNIYGKVHRKVEKLGIDATDDDIYDEIENAMEAVNSRRHYIPTETSLMEENYIGVTVRLCLSSLAKMGAEGEKAHSENGIVRNYDNSSNYPESILKEVVPLAIAR